jgi:hypothetical protein
MISQVSTRLVIRDAPISVLCSETADHDVPQATKQNYLRIFFGYILTTPSFESCYQQAVCNPRATVYLQLKSGIAKLAARLWKPLTSHSGYRTDSENWSQRQARFNIQQFVM